MGFGYVSEMRVGTTCLGTLRERDGDGNGFRRAACSDRLETEFDKTESENAFVKRVLLVRNVAPKEAFADVWTFGSPYVLCGGDKLLKKLGLPRTFVKSVAMGKDIVPRSFSCYYPWWVRRALEMAPGSLRGTALRVSQIPPPRLPALQD